MRWRALFARCCSRCSRRHCRAFALRLALLAAYRRRWASALHSGLALHTPTELLLRTGPPQIANRLISHLRSCVHAPSVLALALGVARAHPGSAAATEHPAADLTEGLLRLDSGPMPPGRHVPALVGALAHPDRIATPKRFPADLASADVLAACHLPRRPVEGLVVVMMVPSVAVSDLVHVSSWLSRETQHRPDRPSILRTRSTHAPDRRQPHRTPPRLPRRRSPLRQ